MEMAIGSLAEKSGCSVQIVRHYEHAGLLPSPPRTGGNQRRYGQAHLKRLQFIRHARELGFSLDDIRELVTLTDRPDQSCAAVDRVAQKHLEEVERRLRQLEGMRAELQRMVRACGRGRIADCRIIETLADFSHQHCQFHDNGAVPAKSRRKKL